MTESYETTVNAKLAALGREFNQNKGFGFMGMLENNHDPQSDAGRAQNDFQQPPTLNQAIAAPPQVPAPAPNPEAEARQAAAYMEPINNAMQGLRTEFGAATSELHNMKNQLAEMRSLQATAPATTADGAPDPFAQKLQTQIANMENSYQKLYRTQLQDRARAALVDVRAKFPDANLGDTDFDQVWRGNGLDENLSTAEKVDWRQHWEMVAKAKSLDKVLEKSRSQEVELERLRSNAPNMLNEMSSAPRTSRATGVGLPQSQIMGPDGFDEQLYDEAVKIMGGGSADRAKGRFMGFNRALVQAQRERSLRGV